MRLRGKQLDAINAALKGGTAEDFNAALQKTCAQAEGIGQFAAAPGCAASECARLAVELDKRADNASEADHQSGEYGNLRHDSEIMRIAQRIFERENQHNDEADIPTPGE